MFSIFKSKQSSTPATVEKEVIILDDLELEIKILDTLDVIENTLKKSYCPTGANTLIQSNTSEPPIITKDGFTILQNMKFMDPVQHNIHTIITSTARNLVKTVGDGSTSSVLVAIHLFRNLVSFKHSVRYNKELLEILNIFTKMLLVGVESSYTYKLNSDNSERVLNAIASVSNNNDSILGAKVASIFSKVSYFSNVKIELDPVDKPIDVTYNISHGFNFSGRLYSSAYLKDKSSLTIQNPIILTSYEFFEQHLEKALVCLNEVKKPIIVIAEIIDSNTANACYAANLRGAPIYLIKSNSLMSDEVRNEFIDLAIYNDSNIVINLEEFEMDFLGSCNSVELLSNRTIFINGSGVIAGTEIYNTRLQEINELLLTTPDNKPIAKGALKTRLDKLNGISISLFVSGRTIEEKSTAKYLVEDAVLACKSSMESGFTLGGNMATLYSARNIMLTCKTLYDKNMYSIKQYCSEDLFEAVASSIFDSYESLFLQPLDTVIFDAETVCDIRNAIKTTSTSNPLVFNLITCELETFDNTTIFAPVNTDKEIIKTSFAIVNSLLSLNQYIS